MEFLANYKYPIIGALIGFTLAILFFTVGFFKTLLLILLTCIGGAVGFYLKRNGIIDKYFKS